MLLDPGSFVDSDQFALFIHIADSAGNMPVVCHCIAKMVAHHGVTVLVVILVGC